jgi:putative transcriptional regulator
LLRAGALVAAAALLGAAGGTLAQEPPPPNGVLLVARPDMPDTRFREAVVLATQTPDGETVGVMLNKPSARKLSELLPGPSVEDHADGIFAGGPVLPQTLVAVFASPEPPAAPAFQVLRGVYMSMHPANVYPLVAQRDRRFRLYAGFSGWRPGQLAAEVAAGGWYLVAAREDLLFRADTSGLWRELVHQASGRRTHGK